jgi:enoyl-CoA hydratase/carnithine racemase
MELYEDLRRAGHEDERLLVIKERRGQRVTLTLADPLRLNSLSAGLNLQLQRHLEEIVEANCFSTVSLGRAAQRLLSGAGDPADDRSVT